MKYLFFLLVLSFTQICFSQERESIPPGTADDHHKSAKLRDRLLGKHYKSLENKLIKRLIEKAPSCNVSTSNLIGKDIVEIYMILKILKPEYLENKDCNGSCTLKSNIQCLFEAPVQSALQDLMTDKFLRYLNYQYDLGPKDESADIEKFYKGQIIKK